MGTEAFYATAAQVLPTILIALTVEIGFFLQRIRRHVEETREQGYEELARHDATDQARMILLSAMLGIAFFVGEVLAFLALGFGWYNVWTFVPISVCMLLMIGGVVLIPLARFLAEVDPG